MTALAWADPFYDRWPTSRQPVSPWRASPYRVANAISAFDVYREPDWVQPTLVRFNQLQMLRDNWDNHGGRPVRRENIEFALQLLAQTLYPSTPTPQIVPLSYGGLQLEWHEKGIDLEIEVIRPNRILVSYEHHGKLGSDFECELSIDFAALARPIAELTS